MTREIYFDGAAYRVEHEPLTGEVSVRRLSGDDGPTLVASGVWAGGAWQIARGLVDDRLREAIERALGGM